MSQGKGTVHILSSESVTPKIVVEEISKIVDTVTDMVVIVRFDDASLDSLCSFMPLERLMLLREALNRRIHRHMKYENEG